MALHFVARLYDRKGLLSNPFLIGVSRYLSLLLLVLVRLAMACNLDISWKLYANSLLSFSNTDVVLNYFEWPFSSWVSLNLLD